MSDMHHWKMLTDCQYLGAYSLQPGQEIVLTIKSVGQEPVIGTDGKKETCVVCHWMENEKPMILNATNMKMIAKVLKSPYVENWIGKKIKIGVDQVRAFGDTVEALRVRKDAPAVKKYFCSDCGGEITAAYGMTAEHVAAYTAERYGKALCGVCAKKLKDGASNEGTGKSD